jgi:hypothetical protein
MRTKTHPVVLLREAWWSSLLIQILELQLNVATSGELDMFQGQLLLKVDQENFDVFETET